LFGFKIGFEFDDVVVVVIVFVVVLIVVVFVVMVLVLVAVVVMVVVVEIELVKVGKEEESSFFPFLSIFDVFESLRKTKRCSTLFIYIVESN